MQKDELNSTYFNAKTDVAQNLFRDFFSNFDCQRTLPQILSEKKYGGTGLISQKTEVLQPELNERAEADTGSYPVTDYSLQYIYLVHVSKNHLNIQS